MPRKIIKDVFFRDKEEEAPLVEELEMEKTKKTGFFQIFNILFDFNFVGRFRLCGIKQDFHGRY